MSTKIYNARRFRVKHLGRFHQDLYQYRKQRLPVSRQQAVEILNQIVCTPEKEWFNRFDEYVEEVHKKNQDSRFYALTGLNPQMDLGVWVHTDGWVYVNPFGSDAEIRLILEWMDELGYVEEYGYWNNCDQPDHISDRRWERRRKKWDEIIDAGDGNWKHFAFIEVIPDFVLTRDLPIWMLFGGTSAEHAQQQNPELYQQEMERAF